MLRQMHRLTYIDYQKLERVFKLKKNIRTIISRRKYGAISEYIKRA